MTAIASSDVTLSFVHKDRMMRSRLNLVDMTFGDSALTYPATGIPIPAKAYLGCPVKIEDVHVSNGATDGYVYHYDRTYHSIRRFQNKGYTPAGTMTYDAHTHDMEFIGGITATEPVAIQAGTILGKAAATNRTILGADLATKGGVVSVVATGSISTTVTAHAITEVSVYHAPAETTIRLWVHGK